MPSLSFLPFPPALYPAMAIPTQSFFLISDKHLLNTYNMLGSTENVGNDHKITLSELFLYTPGGSD